MPSTVQYVVGLVDKVTDLLYLVMLCHSVLCHNVKASSCDGLPLNVCGCREILMTASPHIKTPTMTVPLAVEEGAHQKGLRLKKQFTRVLLSDVSVCIP